MLSSLLGGVAPILQHGHDDGDAQQHKHDGAGDAARLVNLRLRLVRALALFVRSLRSPGVLLACTNMRLVSPCCEELSLPVKHTGNISNYVVLHVLVAAALALCVWCMPSAVHQDLPCMACALSLLSGP